jgi:hypothetical protein
MGAGILLEASLEVEGSSAATLLNRRRDADGRGRNSLLQTEILEANTNVISLIGLVKVINFGYDLTVGFSLIGLEKVISFGYDLTVCYSAN